MSQISPKQIDWSQSISGSLLPYISGSGSVSEFALGSPSASWASAYIGGLQISGSLEAGDGDFDEILVRNKTELRTLTIITGSVKISGSIDLDGRLNIQNLGSIGDREDNLVMDLGGFF